MGKKQKFDLGTLIKAGYLKEGDHLYFVSNEDFTCVVEKNHGHEYKLKQGSQTYTVHALCEEWLGTEPPGHASKWLRNDEGKTLYDLWQLSLEDMAA